MAGTLRTLGETVGDRSSPVCCPPLTFSPLQCSLSSSSTHPFFDHDSSLFLLLLIPSIISSIDLLSIISSIDLCVPRVTSMCPHYIANVTGVAKISLLCFNPSSNSTCFQDRQALRPGLCPPHVPNEEISLAPKPTQTLHTHSTQVHMCVTLEG